MLWIDTTLHTTLCLNEAPQHPYALCSMPPASQLEGSHLTIVF